VRGKRHSAVAVLRLALDRSKRSSRREGVIEAPPAPAEGPLRFAVFAVICSENTANAPAQFVLGTLLLKQYESFWEPYYLNNTVQLRQFWRRREDVLRKVNGAWKVRKRTIVLDANVQLDKNLSVFL